jgi:uncharacterized membrane protein HdeD (DUF308 family)
MNATLVQRDERTVAFENAGYRWGYLVLSFGLLALVAYRSFARHESPWDLLALVILGGAVGTVYQGYHHVLSKHWILSSVLALALAIVVAVVIAWFRP